VTEVVSQSVNLSRRTCMNSFCTPMAFRMHCTQFDMYTSFLHSTLVPDARRHLVCSPDSKLKGKCGHCVCTVVQAGDSLTLSYISIPAVISCHSSRLRVR